MRGRHEEETSEGIGEEDANLGDKLDYLADLVRELRDMVNGTETPRLAGLLDLAYQEALLEKLRRPPRLNR